MFRHNFPVTSHALLLPSTLVMYALVTLAKQLNYIYLNSVFLSFSRVFYCTFPPSNFSYPAVGNHVRYLLVCLLMCFTEFSGLTRDVKTAERGCLLQLWMALCSVSVRHKEHVNNSVLCHVVELVNEHGEQSPRHIALMWASLRTLCDIVVGRRARKS